MTNTIETNNVDSTLSTLETEGHDIGKEYKGRFNKDRAQFNLDSQNVERFDPTLKRPQGYAVRLGFIVSEIAKSEGATSAKKCGISHIPRQRRHESKWFFENLKECQAFISASKKGYQSLTALQDAMKKKARADAKAGAEATTPEAPEAPEATTPELVKVTKQGLADAMVKACKLNDIDVYEVIELMMRTTEDAQTIAA